MTWFQNNITITLIGHIFTRIAENVFSTTLTTELLIKLMPLMINFHHFAIGRHHCFQLPVGKKMTKESHKFLFMVDLSKTFDYTFLLLGYITKSLAAIISIIALINYFICRFVDT